MQAESFHLNGHIRGFRPHTQKVSVILQNSTKHSGSEWVNSLKDGHLFMAGLKSVRLRECRLCLRFCCPI